MGNFSIWKEHKAFIFSSNNNFVVLDTIKKKQNKNRKGNAKKHDYAGSNKQERTVVTGWLGSIRLLKTILNIPTSIKLRRWGSLFYRGSRPHHDKIFSVYLRQVRGPMNKHVLLFLDHKHIPPGNRQLSPSWGQISGQHFY